VYFKASIYISEAKYKYNAFVYTCEDDQEIAEEVQEHLENQGYQVFLKTDVGVGRRKYCHRMLPEVEL